MEGGRKGSGEGQREGERLFLRLFNFVKIFMLPESKEMELTFFLSLLYVLFFPFIRLGASARL